MVALETGEAVEDVLPFLTRIATADATSAPSSVT